MRKGWPAVTPSAGSSPASARSSPRGRQTKMIAHYWLRRGHTGCVKGAAEFLRATRAQRPTHIPLSLWRADAGFGDESFLPACEEVSLPSIVVARLTQKVQSLCRHGDAHWQESGVEGVQVPAVETGRVGRGLILVRQRIATRPEAGGKWLVEVPGDRFQALWTHLPPSVDALNVWRRYHGRAIFLRGEHVHAAPPQCRCHRTADMHVHVNAHAHRFCSRPEVSCGRVENLPLPLTLPLGNVGDQSRHPFQPDDRSNTRRRRGLAQARDADAANESLRDHARKRDDRA